MNIPKSFKLAGTTISVIQDSQLYATRKIVGEAVYSKQTILLDTGHCSQEQIEQNFLHELIHWVFYIMGEDDLRNNERVVDLLAHFLHQVVKTQALQ